jgi:predicted metallopeptidase
MLSRPYVQVYFLILVEEKFVTASHDQVMVALHDENHASLKVMTALRTHFVYPFAR